MSGPNIITRRGFLSQSFKAGLAAAFSTLIDVPIVVKRALAESNLGRNGNKLLFIFLRGANDGLNSLIPIEDPAYDVSVRPDILIPKAEGEDYSLTGSCHFPINTDPNAPTFGYASAIRLGNGFAALHPSLKFLAPVYNAGDLALIHRVGYPKQSRSHFDSQSYWENGAPRNNLTKDGIFYRAMVESGLANTAPLTGVSIQSSLPLLLRGSHAAMTNLADPTRYELLGVPSTDPGKEKAAQALLAANGYPFPQKKSRDLLALQYQNVADTLKIFADIRFQEEDNTFQDDAVTDGDQPWADAHNGQGYYLFPTSNAKNGGWDRPDGTTDSNKYVVDTGAYTFFERLKAAALILDHTDAIVAGTEYGGFDTHNNQGGVAGTHANLNRRLAWAVYALRKYFTLHRSRLNWNNLVVVTLTEFGRTTVQNGNGGTDHAEAGMIFVGGGAVQGYNKGNPSGVFGCHPNDSVPWTPGPADQGGGVDGSMFGVSGRYLKRAVDYRSVLGELIRKHLGASDEQLSRIIPGYGDPGECLLAGGTCAIDGTPIMGEVGLL